MGALLARASEQDHRVHGTRDVQESDREQDQQRYDERELDEAHTVVSLYQLAHGAPEVITGNLAAAWIGSGFTLNAPSTIDAVMSEKP